MKHALTSTAVILAIQVGLLAVALPARAQGSGMAPREIRTPLRPQEAVPASLQEIYRRIAAYWEDQNARAIAQLAGGGRIYVVVQRKGVGERLAAGQLQVLLQEMFGEGQEVDVRFPEVTAYDPRVGSAYAIGQRVWLDSRDSEPRTDRLFVGARNDRGRWVLTEIRLTIE